MSINGPVAKTSYLPLNSMTSVIVPIFQGPHADRFWNILRKLHAKCMKSKPQEQQRPFPGFHGPNDEPLNEEKHRLNKWTMKKYASLGRDGTLWTDTLLEDIADSVYDLTSRDDMVKIRALYMLPVQIEGDGTADYVYISLIAITRIAE
jgi:hypothetical protein